jgi:hypothetical protein
MATFTWYAYVGTPAWTDISANKIVFSGAQATIGTPITVGTWNSGTHLGSGDPPTSDQCGSNHAPNIKYVSSTQFNLNNGSTETLNETNLTQTECTLRVAFTDASAVATSGARIYAYDGSTETVEATGLECYAWENKGAGSTSTWTLINDDSANTGGDNSGERLDLADQASSATHYFYVALSARPESVGAKTFAFGCALTYS